MLFWTRHANLRRVENYIYDPSARIIKNPLNSTVFLSQPGDASAQLRDAFTQLCDASNFTLSKRHLNLAKRHLWRRVRSTPRRVKNAIMTPMAYHTHTVLLHIHHPHVSVS